MAFLGPALHPHGARISACGGATDELQLTRRHISDLSLLWAQLRPCLFCFLEVVCDPLLDYNVWSTLQPINSSGKVDPEKEVIIVATRVGTS